MPAFEYIDPPDPFLPENQFQGWLNRSSNATVTPPPPPTNDLSREQNAKSAPPRSPEDALTAFISCLKRYGHPTSLLDRFPSRAGKFHRNQQEDMKDAVRYYMHLGTENNTSADLHYYVMPPKGTGEKTKPVIGRVDAEGAFTCIFLAQYSNLRDKVTLTSPFDNCKSPGEIYLIGNYLFIAEGLWPGRPGPRMITKEWAGRFAAICLRFESTTALEEPGEDADAIPSDPAAGSSSSPEPQQDAPLVIFLSEPAPPVACGRLSSPPPNPSISDPYLAALGKPPGQAQPQGAASALVVSSTSGPGSAPRMSTSPAKTTKTTREVCKKRKLSAKRLEIEDLETQMETLAAKLEEAKRGVREMESGDHEEKAIPLAVQVEMWKERYRGLKRIWEEMSDDDRYWYYVESEESKIVEHT